MNELTKNDPEYKKVLSSYYDLLKTSILRKDSEEFIGGQPITLLRKHIFNLTTFSKTYRGFSKYTATSKVDGTRLLMYINEPDPNTGFRKVHFIDRSLNIYTLSNKEKHFLNEVKGPKMILDGELVFFKGQKSHYYLPSSETEHLSFMVFDIIYGPTSVKLLDPMIDINPSYGSANSMAGPMGGKQWDYAKRYRILKNLIISTSENSGKPPLSFAFADSPFFRIELKTIVFINEIKSDDVVNYVNQDFLTRRAKYFDFLSAEKGGKKVNDSLKKSTLQYDGLIFTPIDTEYVTGNWNLFMNTQYKWKPLKDQTIDFLVRNTGKTKKIKGKLRPLNEVELYVLSRGNLQLFNFDGKTTGLVDSKFVIEDNTIAEFEYSPELSQFVFTRLRLDKDKPNAWRTANTVKESIQAPVDINLLPKLISDPSKDYLLKVAKDYLSEMQLNTLLLCSGLLTIIPEFSENTIKELIDSKFRTKEMECEMRLGNIRGKNFNAGVPFPTFLNTIKLLDNIGWRHEKVNYVDTSKGNLRTRYRFIPAISQLVKEESIIKESIGKVDVSLKSVAPFDLRFASSSEKLTDSVVKFEEATRITEKTRISYYDPNGVIRVDLTDVVLSELEDNTIKQIGKNEYQVEFEVLKNDYGNIIKFLNYYISELGTVWD